MEVRKIVITGPRNAGKSTLMNLLTGSKVSIVSPVAGTTTDPVRKRMEVPGVGICVFVDTAGLDDSGELGLQRIKRSMEEAESADLILSVGMTGEIEKFRDKTIVVEDFDREKLLRLIADKFNEGRKRDMTILSGLVKKGDTVVLVCPIDNGAPQGRLILPQVQAIRDILDHEASAVVLQPQSLGEQLESGLKPDLVVTDSQAFAEVSSIVPEDIPLTSFSMLLSRSKGCFEHYIKGIQALDTLKSGDRVLILESCTHRSSCDDIGRVKLPALLKKHCGAELEIDFISGLSPLPENLNKYALAIQCGACMISRGELAERIGKVVTAGVPVSNYGMVIAYIKGVYDRAIKPLTLC